MKGLLWSDEFSGNLSQWNQQVGGDGWGNQELQMYQDGGKNAMTQNGFLKIVARRENAGKNQYTSGRLISKKSFKYGVFEARLKLPRGAGTWPGNL